MPKTRSEKAELQKALTEKFNNAKGVVFTDYSGSTVAEMTELRRTLRAAGVEYKVAKATLVERALKDSRLKDLEFRSSKKPLAVAFGTKDEIAAAQLIYTFARKNKKPAILGGIIEGKLYTAAEVTTLAKLPGREVLLGQLVGVLAGPLRGLMTVLSGNMRGLVTALDAVRKQKEGKAAA